MGVMGKLVECIPWKDCINVNKYMFLKKVVDSYGSTLDIGIAFILVVK